MSKFTLDLIGSLKDNNTHRLDLGGDDNQQKTSKLQTHTWHRHKINKRKIYRSMCVRFSKEAGMIKKSDN